METAPLRDHPSSVQNEPLLWTRFDAAAFDPFQLPLVSSLPLHRRAALLAARPLLTRLLALGELRRLYERAHAAHGPTFCARALNVLGVGVDLAANSEPAVPAAGPVIVVANHPHGMLDGLALVDVVERSRRDVRVLSNELLASLPALTNMCIFVHAFDGRA